MVKWRVFAFSFIFPFLLSSVALAQFPIVSAEDVKTWMTGKQKVVLIDSRMPDEYQAGHIPGAINIPAEQMKTKASRLPKDKAAPIIFYCRGMS